MTDNPKQDKPLILENLKIQENTPDKSAEAPSESASPFMHATKKATGRLDVFAARLSGFFDADDDIPLSQHIILVVVAAFFVVFILWANFASLDEVTRGNGTVVPSTEVQILQSLEGGIIEEISVREGDSVKTGQVLIRLRDVGASSDLGATNKRYLGLKAQATRLQAEAEGNPLPAFDAKLLEEVPESVASQKEAYQANKQSLDSQLAVLEERLSQRKQEIRELNSRISDLRSVIRLSKEEMDMIAPLVERGSAPKVELIQLERAMQEQQTELNSLLTSLPRTRSAAEEAEARKNELINSAKATAQNELSATTIEMNSLKESLTGLSDRKDRTEITSRVDGTVKDIKATSIGGVVQPGQDLIEIVPEDDQLIVVAHIRPADIAFLHPGQNAVVKITAYDYSIYGGLRGELIDISADAISNEEGETFYRVKVRTNDNSLKREGQELKIIPGMVASIDILTGEKTVMEYILKPLIKTLDSAMNER